MQTTSHNPLMQTFGRDQLNLNPSRQNQADRTSLEKGQAHLKNIDQINSKINGLIRSISESCKQQQQRKRSAKPGRIDTKGEEGQHRGDNWQTDYKQTQKKKCSMAHTATGIGKPSVFDTYHQWPDSVANRLKHRRMHSIEGEQDDEISNRIQKLNEKINKYGQKIGFNFSSHPKPKRRSNQENQEGQKRQSEVKKKSGMRDITQGVNNSNAANNYGKGQGTQGKKKPQSNRQTVKQDSFIQISRQEYIQQSATDRYKNSFDSITIESSLPAAKASSQAKRRPALLQALARQIALDHSFRNAKHMYGGICDLFNTQQSHHDRKWKALQKQLREEGHQMKLSQVREVFMPRDDEVDPFMSVSHSHDEAILGLVRTFTEAQDHWKQKLYRGWSLQEFRQIGLKQQALDSRRKGYLTVQDLTAYLNTRLDGGYRNRDVVLLFNRLAGPSAGEKVRFKSIADQLLSA